MIQITQANEAGLDERQRREQDYHRTYAASHVAKANEAVALDVIQPGPRRPWNGYWVTYDLLIAEQLAGKRVLIPGCGFGEDAIRLAKLDAHVFASDLSPELLAVTRQRARNMGVLTAEFSVMPAESLSYPDNFFDVVYFNDILHHVDIPRAVAEAKRVLKPGGVVIANELYTHSRMQRMRTSPIVSGLLYKHMVGFIYGTETPYITEDEHKIDEHELTILEAALRPGIWRKNFLFLGGRLLPKDWLPVARFDQAVFALTGAMGNMLAGRVVLRGVIAK